MSHSPEITVDMTVRELNLRYPACRAVFDKYGLGGCGGKYGPPEPIDFFARAHNAPLEQMLSDLREAAEKGDAPTVSEDSDARIAALYRRFIKAALVMTITLGTGWGVLKLTEITANRAFVVSSYAGTQAHGHAQLFGWVGLFIMGMAYFAVPRFMNTTLPRMGFAYASFYLMLAGIVVRSLAQAYGPYEPFMTFSIAGAVAELAAVLIFAWLMVETLMAKQEKREPFEKYLVAGVVWFVVAMSANLWLTIITRDRSTAIIPAEYNPRFLHLVVFGFMTNIIFGVSLRILPNFMGQRQPLERPSRLAFSLYNAGLLIRILGFAPVIAGAHELAGTILFLYALGVFTKPVIRVDIPGVDGAFSWFVKLAYAWFFAAMLMVFGADIYGAVTGAEIPHAYVGAYRHAVTVGFISTLMVGVAYRVLPIFAGSDLKWAWTLRVSFFLILIGNIMRVGFQLATISGNPAFFIPMGISGYLELAALTMFSISIWKTMDENKDAFLEDHVVRPETKVANIMDLYPGTRLVLIGAGLHHLTKLRRAPGFVTVAFAANRHGLDPNEITAILNEFITEASKKEVKIA